MLRSTSFGATFALNVSDAKIVIVAFLMQKLVILFHFFERCLLLIIIIISIHKIPEMRNSRGMVLYLFTAGADAEDAYNSNSMRLDHVNDTP